MNLKVEYVPVDSIKPYAGNAKIHTPEQVEQIKRSIEEFGFNDPIAVWHDEIVEGHGRLMAAKELGIDQLPIIRLDGLTDEERRGYILAHNMLTMNTGFDTGLLAVELEKLPGLDMEQFGFEYPELPSVDDGFFGDERLRTDKAYHLGELDEAELTNDFWQMPVIKNDGYTPADIIGFNYAKTNKEKNVGIHFYIDDYQFERVWSYPEKYLPVLQEYDCIISPDFSLYVDMPTPMKIWNTYRNRFLGAYYQKKGLKVIPNVRWDGEDTYQFAFAGIPKGSIIACSTVSLKTEFQDRFVYGMEECIKRIEPEKILIYGGMIDFNSHGIETICYDNSVTKRMRGR